MSGQVDKRDEHVEAMVRLVQRTFPDGGRSEESGLHRLQGRIARKRQRRRTAFGLSVLLAAAAPVAILLALRPAPLTFEVIHGAIGAAGEVRPTAPGTQIRFSDGTAIVLEDAARAQVRDVAAHGAGIVLVDGRAHTSFVPKPKARWQVLAGPYVVRVTGTVFDVSWSRDREQLDVWLKKGSVLVTGPLVEAGVAVGRAQHLSLRPTDHRIVLENDVEAPPGQSQSAVAPAHPVGAAEQNDTVGDEELGAAELGAAGSDDRVPDPARLDRARDASAGGSTNASSNGSWGRRLAQGDFEAVVASAQRRGLHEVLARGSRADLAALADAARYTRRGELARRALLAQRSRFAGSTEAREAAYFLGVLAEDEGAWREALSWYAGYRRDDPAGTYAAPALGRTLLLEARRQGNDAARADADAYLRRYPTGPYAHTAREIAGASAEDPRTR